jgi:hypothetical protein
MMNYWEPYGNIKRQTIEGWKVWGGGGGGGGLDGDVIDNMVEIRFQTNVKF